MLIGLQDWIHLLALPFAHEIKKGEEELEMVKTVETENYNFPILIFRDSESNPTELKANILSLTTTLMAQRVTITALERLGYLKSASRLARLRRNRRLATRATRDSSNPGEQCSFCIEITMRTPMVDYRLGRRTGRRRCTLRLGRKTNRHRCTLRLGQDWRNSRLGLRTSRHRCTHTGRQSFISVFAISGKWISIDMSRYVLLKTDCTLATTRVMTAGNWQRDQN